MIVQSINYNINNSNPHNLKSLKNNAAVQQTFTGKPEGFYYLGKTLYNNKKKYTGPVELLYLNGTKLVMEFKKGIIQKAKKLGSDKIFLTKFSPKGEELLEIPTERKVLYEKEYLYSKLGELIQVKKNDRTIYNKEYEFDLSKDTPITKKINDNDIIEFLDINGTKQAMAIPGKYIRADYTYADGLQHEVRYSINKKAYDFMESCYKRGLGIPEFNFPIMQKTHYIVRNPLTKEYQITILNNMEAPIKTKVYDSTGNISFYVDYKYNKDNQLAKKITTTDNFISEEYYNKLGLPVATKVKQKSNNKLVQQVTREFDSENKVLISETSTHYFHDEHIKTVNKEIYSPQEDLVTYSIIHTDNNKKYTKQTKVENSTQRIIEEKFFGPEMNEISRDEFMKNNIIVNQNNSRKPTI